METSTSPLQVSVQETRAALEEIRRHGRLSSDSWRRRLDAAQRRLDDVGEGQHNQLALRAARATAATAATEAALAARFDARLLKLSPDKLHRARDRLESHLDGLHAAQGEAAAHLHEAVEALLTVFEEHLGREAGAQPAARARRYQMRTTDELVKAMRTYGDRIEQLLFELVDAMRACVGVSMGAVPPTRILRNPPRLELGRMEITGAARLPVGLGDVVWRTVELYQDMADERVDEAIRALRSRFNRATEDARRGEQHIRQRIRQLMRQAQRLDELAEQLDWMLPSSLSSARRLPTEAP
jgi:hypothetical protein